jgi:hypothetical protein
MTGTKSQILTVCLVALAGMGTLLGLMSCMQLIQSDGARLEKCLDLPVLADGVEGFNWTIRNLHLEPLEDDSSQALDSESPWELGAGGAKAWLGESVLKQAPLYLPSDRPRGLRIAFLGDSITRNQVVSLIHYIHTGYWIHDKMEPNLLNEASFANMTEFYAFSSRYFNGPHNFRCDCHQDPTDWALAFGENIFYQDHCRDVHISYLSKARKIPFRGHWDPHNIFVESNITSPSEPINTTLASEEIIGETTESNATLASGESNVTTTSEDSNSTATRNEAVAPLGGYNLSDVRAPYSWTYDSWTGVVRNYIAKLDPKPDYLVLNSGRWGSQGLNEDSLQDIRAAAEKAGITVIYKTTTTGADASISNLGLMSHDDAGCRLLHYCLPMNWTAMVAPFHYFDKNHFKSYLNTRFNEQLLELLSEISS